MKVTIPVTKILFVWVVSLVICALCGLTKGVLVVATLVALIPKPRLRPDQR